MCDFGASANADPPIYASLLDFNADEAKAIGVARLS
jgi:hypothetical protein